MSFAWRSHLPLLLVPLLACAPDKDPLDTLTQGPTGSPTGGSNSNSGGSNSGGSNSGGSNSGSSTDDPTGGTGTDSAGTATTGDTGGGGVHPSCQQWIECVAAVDPDNYPMIEQTYGPSSTCWQLTPEIAQMCIDACENSLDAYGRTYPDEPACGGSGSTSTSTTNTTETTQTTRTTETDPSGGDDYGNCGWDAGNAFYACGFPGQIDPQGTPIDCPMPLPAEGDPCDENGPVDGIGCCTPSGANYFCTRESTVFIEDCGP